MPDENNTFVTLESAGVKSEKISNILKLIAMIIVFILCAGRAYWDIYKNQQQIEINKRSNDAKLAEIRTSCEKQIEEIKKKSEEDNKKISEIQTDVAVTRTEMAGVSRQQNTLLFKVEKIYEIVINK